MATPDVTQPFVPIPAGAFERGSDDPAATWDQSPAHRVTFAQGFEIATAPVTAEQFRAFRPDAIADEQGFVVGVPWHDAVAFCAWLGERDGATYRLPTEAEWERACPAGAFAAMARNEWCHDWYGPYPADDQTDPVGPASGLCRVVRGGVIDEPSNHCDPAKYEPARQRGGLPPAFGVSGAFGRHRVGFRLVRGPLPTTAPTRPPVPFAFDGVRQAKLPTHLGPPIDRPHYRKRVLMPIPPDGATREQIDAAGFSRFFRNDHHSPGLAALPNGDLLAIYYSSFHEYDPEVGFVATRLRFGCDEWDWPERAIDLPGVNDHAPLLWQDGATTWLAWGTPQLAGRFPFHFTRSRDHGATWDAVTFPRIVGDVGPLEKAQPINTMLRDARGTLYLPTDAVGGSSALWASDDDGETWRDTGGRTFGRHTTFALASDGRTILGFGGKSTQLDGFMPLSTSRDGGATYEITKTPFPAQTSGQRPCVIRLASGRLFFCGDYQNKQAETPLPGKPVGCYAALSDDDGRTWRTRTLPGTIKGKKQIFTLGYSVARQSPNGIIHVITSRTIPALHFELNEAWILASDDGRVPDDATLTANPATTIRDVREYRETHADGSPRLIYHAGLADDGRWLLHGDETWFHPDGRVAHRATYALGRRVGVEERFAVDGRPVERWDHGDDGVSTWTTYNAAGRERTTTRWRERRRIDG